jgi:aminopeptidase YwaD
MGRNTIFPGAHDNASGTAFMMYMARYFAQHPQRYSIAFIGFSGEEAGLLGSKHYVADPLFPLANIRFLVNLDMTGDATNGITVVNGTENEPEFAIMEEINNRKQYLPKINKREKTANSDHYHFAEKGVPAVFIYGNGTKGFYHDVFDVAKELSLENIDKLAHMLIDFTGRVSGTK